MGTILTLCDIFNREEFYPFHTGALTGRRETIYGLSLHACPSWKEGWNYMQVNILIKSKDNQISQQSGIMLIFIVPDADLHSDKAQLFYFFVRTPQIKY